MFDIGHNIKFTQIVVYESNSDMFDIGHCQVKVTVGLQKFPAIQYDRFYNLTLGSS